MAMYKTQTKAVEMAVATGAPTYQMRVTLTESC